LGKTNEELEEMMMRKSALKYNNKELKEKWKEKGG